MSGYVYFFGVEDALKVGHTVDVRKRLVTAQTMHRSTVELVAVDPGTVADEKAWHARLADYAIRGEWFALCVGSRRLLAGLSTELPDQPIAGPDAFTRYLASAMERLHLSQSAFARAIGVTPSNVNHWVSGRYRPGRDFVAPIAAVLGRPVDEVAAAVAS